MSRDDREGGGSGAAALGDDELGALAEKSREALALNHAWWEERAGLHLGTPLYRRMLERLRGGGLAVTEIELEELREGAGRARRADDPAEPGTGERLGDHEHDLLAGLDVLHLQCHVGTDTLSLARLGARVTGVDFSETALEQARALADELHLEARFIHSSIEELASRMKGADADLAGLAGGHDVVFTSWGTTTWLSDLGAWAEAITLALRPGGRLHVIDGHPALSTIGDGPAKDGTLQLEHPYFSSGGPIRFDDAGSYADLELETRANATVEFPHALEEILGALLARGLVLESFREHRRVPWPALACCTEDPPGTWSLPEPLFHRLPLAYSLRARKPASLAALDSRA